MHHLEEKGNAVFGGDRWAIRETGLEGESHDAAVGGSYAYIDFYLTFV